MNSWLHPHFQCQKVKTNYILQSVTAVLQQTTVTFSVQIGRKMQSPYMKFVSHSGAYIFFLGLVFTATSRQGSGSPWLDIACKGFIQSMPDSIVYMIILIFVIGEWLVGFKSFDVTSFMLRFLSLNKNVDVRRFSLVE